MHRLILAACVAGLLSLAFAAPTASNQLQRVYFDHAHLFLMPDCPDGTVDFAGPSGARDQDLLLLQEGVQEPGIVGAFKGVGTVMLELSTPNSQTDFASYPPSGSWAWSLAAAISASSTGTLTVRVFTSPTAYTDQVFTLAENGYPWSFSAFRVPGATGVDFLWDVPVRSQIAAEWLGWFGGCWPGAGDPFSQVTNHLYLDLTLE